MQEYENIVTAGGSVPSLIVTVALMAAIPVFFFVFWRKTHRRQTRIAWLLAGAVGFLVSARVLELGVHYLCVLADNPVSRFINGSTAAYVLYGITMAGVFEECGRHLVMKHLLKKDRMRENAVLYGIGHGGVEILAVILPVMIVYLMCAVLFSSGDTQSALRALNITEETAAAALPSVLAATAFDPAAAALSVIERGIAMFLHIALTVIVYDGVVTKEKLRLPLSVLLHMAADTFPALNQRGVVPLWSVEVWVAAWTAVSVCAAVRLYRNMDAANAEGSV